MSGIEDAPATPCPECSAPMPVHPEYVTWCAACNWNLRPQAPPEPKNLRERLYARLGERHSEALFRKLKGTERSGPQRSAATVLALALATLVHLCSLGFVAAGIWLIVALGPYPVQLLGALGCFGLAWLSRPRFGKWPDEVLSRSDYPALYDLADRVAEALGTDPVDGILLDRSFNAFWQSMRDGRRLMTIGLPRLAILDPGETVALMAHEQAHGCNGDPARLLYLSTALNTLGEWYGVIRPSYLWNPASGVLGLLMVPFNLVFYAAAGLAWLGGYVLVHLIWRDSQQAEYLADQMAAEVSGTGAAQSALEKGLLGLTVYVVVRQYEHGRAKEAASILEQLRIRAKTVPPSEIERLKRAHEQQGARLDVTHPPTTYRSRMLDERLVLAPKVSLSQQETAQIDEELARFLEGAGAGWWRGIRTKGRAGGRGAASSSRAPAS